MTLPWKDDEIDLVRTMAAEGAGPTAIARAVSARGRRTTKNSAAAMIDRLRQRGELPALLDCVSGRRGVPGHAGYDAERALRDLFRRDAAITVEQAAAAAGVTDWTARRILKSLADRGFLTVRRGALPRSDRYRRAAIIERHRGATPETRPAP